MNKQEKDRRNRAMLQAAKNVGAAALGSGIGYYGGGYLTRKAIDNPRVKNYLKKLPKSERKKMLHRIRLTGGLAGAAAGGMSSLAMQKALEGKDEQEKTASFFTIYAMRTLV